MRTVRVKLPEALLKRIEALADKHYATAGEFIRRMVTDYFVTVDQDAVSAGTMNVSENLPFVPAVPRVAPPSRGKSGYKGVYQNGRRWFACVVSDKQRKVLGTFDNPGDAARAYDNELIRRADGDLCAAVNFPGPDSKLAEATQPFLDKFVAGTLTDEDRKAWQAVQSTFKPPRDPFEMPVVPQSAPPPSKPEPRTPDEAEPDEEPEVAEPEVAEPEPVDPDEAYEVLPVLPEGAPNDGIPRPLVPYNARPKPNPVTG
jgi:hypothetical protein